jgi:transposase-like protein
MGQILHGSATTTEAVRRAIQNSQASLRKLAGRYGINPKTIAKWRRRSSVCYAAWDRGSRAHRFSNQEEALVVAFRKHTLLPLDDCLYALRATVPHLTRSSLHRCFQRHGISRVPETQGDNPLGRSSCPIQSATSTSTLPRCEPSRASSTRSWQSIGHRNSPTPSYMRRPIAGSPQTFSKP